MNTPRTRPTGAAQTTRRLLAVAACAAAVAAVAVIPSTPAARAESGSAVDGPRPRLTPSPTRHINWFSTGGGAIAFLSDRPGSGPSGVDQVWFKADAYDAAPPTQLTSAPEGARSPVWFPRTTFGLHVAYVTRVGADDVIQILRTDDPAHPVWTYATAAQDLGTHRIDYLTWSNSGLRLCFAHYNDWYDRGLACITFPTHAVNPHPNFPVFDVAPVVPVGHNPAPSESTFSSDDTTLYLSGDKGAYRGYLYSVPAGGGTLTMVRDNTGQTVRKAFAPSVGRDGAADVLIYNSERYTADPARGEELIAVDLATGAVTELTSTPGHQYGSFQRGSNSASEIVMQSDADLTIPAPAAEAHTDLYVGDLWGTTVTKVDIADPDNQYDDGAPDWIR